MTYRYVKERALHQFVVTPDGPCLFRFESGTTANLRCMDDWTIEQYPELILYAYPIIKFTPKGYWIQGKYIERFVRARGEGTRRFAYSDPVHALESFIIRKRMHISYLERKLIEVRGALNIARSIVK
jgi:hypothetical protein